MEHEQIKLIALDIDGTLLNSQGEIPARNRDALLAALGQGVTVALASGRMTNCISPFADEMGLDCPIIGYNGGMVRGTKKDGRPEMFHRPLEVRYGRELIDYCRGRYMLNFYCDDVLYAEETAELLGISKASVYQAKSRVLKQVKERLEAVDPDSDV